MQVLPIGSVVQAKKEKLLITGYQLLEQKEELRLGYFAVKYPRGFAGIESVGVLQEEEIEGVLAEGYRCEKERKYTKGLSDFSENIKTIKASNWRMFTELLEQKLKNNREDA